MNSHASSLPRAPVLVPADPDVQVMRGLTYGKGGVGFSRPEGPLDRELKMDVYLPGSTAAPPALRPVLVMAFGGAFHRGSKENDAFESEAGNTSVAEYCLRFARRGYVACSIDYRLVPEDPTPGSTPVVADPQRIPTSRVDLVRRLMDLPPATADMLWRGIEAASDDMAAAVRFVRHQAHAWAADPGRIAVGGFSAGARTALNAAFGEHIDVAAVVALSGFMDGDDLQRMLSTARARPPAVLLVSAENDLDYIVDATPGLVRRLRRSDLQVEQIDVPEAGHFYKAEAVALADADTGARRFTTVEKAMADFLDRVLRAGALAD